MDADMEDRRPNSGGHKRRPSDTPLPLDLGSPGQPTPHSLRRRSLLHPQVKAEYTASLSAALKAIVSSYDAIDSTRAGSPPDSVKAADAVLAEFVAAASTPAALYAPWPETGADDAAGYGLSESELAALAEDVKNAVPVGNISAAASVTTAWSVSLPATGAPTTLALGTFDWEQPGPTAVFGGHDAGRLAVVQHTSPAQPVEYETKQATITAMLAFSLFPHSAGGHDLVIGDAHGECRVFSAWKCVGKCRVGAAVTTLEGVTDMLNNRYVLAGDAAGTVTAFDAMHILWRIRVGGMGHSPTPQPFPPSPSITSIVHVTLPAPMSVQLTLIAHGAPSIQVFSGNTRIRTIGMPSAIAAMASGSFRPGPGIQILAAGIHGDVFIVDGATLVPARYVPIWSTVTHIAPLPAAPGESGDHQEQAFAVAGLFCQLRIYKGQKVNKKGHFATMAPEIHVLTRSTIAHPCPSVTKLGARHGGVPAD
ncbi:hypothetical protein HDU87_006175 [Geranomyces variabilis]|uniref:Uncharacterized protein n=1 Tax=Geranomyces variabilis TaxID=109894 RepID=A0AAD5XP89_9FUNG|nr:hypothetical protein HDU87_006175 [Geranomyces variabilis]